MLEFPVKSGVSSTIYLEAGILNCKQCFLNFFFLFFRIKQDWKLLVETVAWRLSKMSFLFQIHYRDDWLAALLLLCPSTYYPVISKKKHKSELRNV